LSIPTFFKQAQRQALLSSLNIAALDCLSLVHDTSAACITFVTQRLPASGGLQKPYFVMIPDFGSQGLQISIFRIIRTLGNISITALAHEWSLEVGGDRATSLVCDYLQKNLAAKYSGYADRINNDKKIRNRLLKASESIKKTLSSAPNANEVVEVIPGELEGVMVSMSRKEIDEIIEDMKNHILNTVKRAVENAVKKLTGFFYKRWIFINFYL
jgi:molecular chaperone DnaK (HSP70)